MAYSKSRLVLLGTVAVMLAAAPVTFDGFDMSGAVAQAAGSGNSGGGGGNSGGGGGNSDGGSGGGGNDNAGSGSGAGKGAASSGGSGAAASGGGSEQSGGSQGGSAGEGGQKGESAGGQGAKGKPVEQAVKGGGKGDVYGDLYVVLRDENGVPILTPEGFVQPLDAYGNLIPLDEEGHPIDESLVVEVELGRLNVGRAPRSVLINRGEEVISLLESATALSTDAAGRLVLTVDGVEQTIDSPLENLAIYVALMQVGTIPGISDLPGTEFDFMVDGVYTVEDLIASASFLAAATDKTGEFSTDEIAYINAFLGVNTVTVGTVTYSEVDFADFSYDRSDVYEGVTAEVLVQQPDGTWISTEVDVYDAVFGGVDAADAGSLEAYTLAADDARQVVDFLHEYEIPATDSGNL
ncbi:hypothetical protein [Actibacterium sp. D379-3]